MQFTTTEIGFFIHFVKKDNNQSHCSQLLISLTQTKSSRKRVKPAQGDAGTWWAHPLPTAPALFTRIQKKKKRQ